MFERSRRSSIAGMTAIELSASIAQADADVAVGNVYSLSEVRAKIANGTVQRREIGHARNDSISSMMRLEGEVDTENSERSTLSLRQRMMLDGRAACHEVRFVPLDEGLWIEAPEGECPQMPSGENVQIDERQVQFEKIFAELGDEVGESLEIPYLAIIAGNVLDLDVDTVGLKKTHVRITIPHRAFIDYPITKQYFEAGFN
jgi:hypothetical protein